MPEPSPVAVAPPPAAPYYPPYTRPLTPLLSLLRVLWRGDGDLLSLVPAAAYRVRAGWLGYSRRSILIVNAPEWVREILVDAEGIFPKSDLMVGALEPLVGNSMFVASGAAWQRQRRMIDPAFSHMRVSSALPGMTAAVDDCAAQLDATAAAHGTVSLDYLMSQLTADIICRTVFSTELANDTARDVFDAFAVFERSCAQVRLARLIFDPAWTPVRQDPAVLDACAQIRRHLGRLVDPHLAAPEQWDDIAAMIVRARDPADGSAFSRAELLDQLGVMFLAGHETTASALTWTFFILATQPAVLARVRAEVERVAGDGPIGFEHLRQLDYVRAVFRETLRLYPPITFIPRVAERATRIGPYRVRRGALIMIAPWVIHRHRDFWRDPHRFDPDRFRDGGDSATVPGTFLPFGYGPRVCVGASFATMEATLIIARLARRYDFTALDPGRVRPVARLTTRPAEQVLCRIAPRGRG